jgi:hypothetical protein
VIEEPAMSKTLSARTAPLRMLAIIRGYVRSSSHPDHV